ncbi:amidase signature domain-containing protein [Lipomyces arxii]|uniref:amidase signature domain-containing protein n=1 Tax=Lipomyces arxii TaxID=56418 RepID=UPI0034CF94C6
MAQKYIQRVVEQVNSRISTILERNTKINALTYIRPKNEIQSIVQRLESVPEINRGPLFGKVVVLKDNICVDDCPTSCASMMLKGFQSGYNATVTDLLSKSGTVHIAMANMDEFAMGTDNIHTVFGPPKNPQFPDADHSTGGSSGGSAAAVSAGMCDIALGTDTGGSVRLPAAYCGVVGFKPSYGLISRHGVIAFSQTLDTVGILARYVETVQDTFDALSKYDSKDPTSATDSTRKRIAQFVGDRDSTLEQRDGETLYRIGIPQEFVVNSLSPVIKKAWTKALNTLRLQGHKLYPVSLPSIKSALPTYYIIAPAEAASNLARYDGVRYGYRATVDRDSSDDILYGTTRSEGFGTEVRRRILLGNYNLSSGAIDNHYIQAQKVRSKIQADFDRVFALKNATEPAHKIEESSHVKVDFLVAPCSTGTAPLLDDVLSQKSPLDAYINDVLTVPASLTGTPAISIPYKVDNEVVGIQIMSQYGDDYRLLEFSQELESLCR